MGSLAGTSPRQLGHRLRRLLRRDVSTQMERAAPVQPAALSTVIRLARREPMFVANSAAGLTVLESSQIGFAGAAEDDRRRWLISFRRMLDGLDAPLQVVIDVVPGPDHKTNTSHPVPRDLDDMRGADIEFAAAVRRSSTAHSTTTRLAIAEKYEIGR